MRNLWQRMMSGLGGMLRYASDFFLGQSVDTTANSQTDNEEDLTKLKELLDSELLTADDLELKDDDEEATAVGVSLGFTQPVYLVVASPEDRKVLTLDQLKKRATKDTLENLSSKQKGEWAENDDNLFGPHTLLVVRCLDRDAPLLAIQAWEEDIRTAVEDCEQEIQNSDPAARIHKGAILHNVALCHLIAGDLDSAFQLYAAAGKEDQLSGRGGWENVVLGNHPLTEQYLLQKVIDEAGSLGWVQAYQETLGVKLDLNELKALLRWLANKEQDAIHVLHAIHRILNSKEKFPNLVQPHIQVRAIADIILVVESSIRHWQTPPVQGELHNKISALLPNGSPARAAFETAHRDYCTKYPSSDPNRATEVGINWAISDCLSKYQAEASPARRVGIIAYLCLRLRNSLMHVILDPVSLYSNNSERMKVAGMMIAAVGISKMADEGTLQTT